MEWQERGTGQICRIKIMLSNTSRFQLLHYYAHFQNFFKKRKQQMHAWFLG